MWNHKSKARLPSYGWVIVVVAAMAMVATLPGRTYGLGMITERLLEDPHFDLNRINYSQINLWATLLGALFCLPCGWLIDRFGLRLTLTATLGCLSAVVLWMTRIEDRTTLTIAILLTRGFGQSALSVISITMVGKWFAGRLSMPMAIYSLVLSLGFAYSAQLAKPFRDLDWRVLWESIGYSLLAFIPIAFVLTRNPPKQKVSEQVASKSPANGCCESKIQSGSNAWKSEHTGNSTDQLLGHTLQQAMATQAFWVFGLAISLVALIGAGISLFNESVLQQQGFSTEVFYNLITLTGTVGLLVKIPVGWLAQKVSLNRMLAAGLFLQAICMAFLPIIHSTIAITAYGIGMGISGTITTVLFFTIWGQAYGQAHLGKIQSTAQMMTVVASAVGPILFATMFERFGSYTYIIESLAGGTLVIGIWSCLISVPIPKQIHSQIALRRDGKVDSALPVSLQKA